MNEFILPWTDSIALKKDCGWFGGGSINAIFKINFTTRECKFVQKFPDSSICNFRQYTQCIRQGNEIIFFPIYGNYIFFYNYCDNVFDKIDLKRYNLGDMPRCYPLFIHEGFVFVWAATSKSLLIVDSSLRIIKTFRQFPNDIALICKSLDKIYLADAYANHICEYDFVTEKTENLRPSIPHNKYSTIATSNEYFWFTGYEKNIIKWNRNLDQYQTISDFDESFGFYKIFEGRVRLDTNFVDFNSPVFFQSIDLGQHIWFIPFRTNYIYYLNKKNDVLQRFDIGNEMENYYSWNRTLNHKYLVQYIYNNRYIGLYSLKNKCILEIDSKELNYKKVFFNMKDDNLKELLRLYIEEKKIGESMFYEDDEMHRQLFEYYLLCGLQNPIKKDCVNIGDEIYKLLNEIG